MEIEHLIHAVREFDGTLVLAPGPGSVFPEIAWGDSFFYFAPDGEVPQNEQPFATIVTKDYPDDASSQLGSAGSGRWRVNLHVGSARFRELLGRDPGAPAGEREPDPATSDVVIAHPVYGALGWVSVVEPGERTSATVLRLLTAAYRDARARRERRESVDGS